MKQASQPAIAIQQVDGTQAGGPFIFIGTHSVKEGQFENFRKFKEDFVEFIKASEPRLIAFNIYFDSEGTEMTVVQVHPDAESMEFHMQVAGEKIAESYHYLGETRRIEVYGTPSEGVLRMIRHLAGSGVPLSVKSQHLGGFTRSQAG
jgi:hypothetical protein